MAITYRDDLFGIDWRQLQSLMVADHFDNDRTSDQLRQAFAGSRYACVAWHQRRVVATARVLSDGASNACFVDVWTWSPLRGRGIASTMIQRLTSRLAEQHLILETEVELVPFDERIGFSAGSPSTDRDFGRWLRNDESENPLRSINANEGGVPTLP